MAVGSGSEPSVTLSAIVPRIRPGDCPAHASQSAGARLRTSVPARVAVPVNAAAPRRAAIRLDLPEPLGPSTSVIVPGAAVNETGGRSRTWRFCTWRVGASTRCARSTRFVSLRSLNAR